LTTAAARRGPALDAPALLLGAAIAVSAGLLIELGSRLTFLIDEWDFLLHRGGHGLGVFLEPHNEHPVIAPLLIWKAIQATLGMDSMTPYVVASLVAFITSVVLLFVYLRRRVGPWLALAGAVLILFLGAAWEDLLLPFQIGYFGSTACGLGMLLALDRHDSNGDRLACVLLVLALTFSSLGLPFAAGAALDIGLRDDRWRRAYVVAVPLLLYALWWLGWGHVAESRLSLDAASDSLSYVLDGLSASIASLFGLISREVGGTVTVALDWGRPLLVLALIAAGVVLAARSSIRRGVAVVAVIALAFWLFAAVNAGLGRAPTESRYQYVGVVVIMLVAAELASGLRPGRGALALVFAVLGLSLLGNLLALRASHRDVLTPWAQAVRGGLAGLEIARDTVDSGFLLTRENSDRAYFDLVDAGSYLAAVDAFGSPAFNEAELQTAPAIARRAADKVIAAALGVAVAPLPERPSGRCLRSVGNRGTPRVLPLPPGGAALELGPGGGQARLRRYASEEFPVELGAVPAGSSRLAIPSDRSDEPWELELVAEGPVSVCRL
jgi:hypothetical protein